MGCFLILADRFIVRRRRHCMVLTRSPLLRGVFLEEKHATADMHRQQVSTVGACPPSIHRSLTTHRSPTD